MFEKVRPSKLHILRDHSLWPPDRSDDDGNSDSDGGRVVIPLPFALSSEPSTGSTAAWPIDAHLSELLSSSTETYIVIPFKPLFVLRGHPGCPQFSHTIVPPKQLHNVLKGAIVATQFVINHHKFPNHHSFTGLIKALYVLQAGPGAPDMEEAVYSPRVHSGVLHLRLLSFFIPTNVDRNALPNQLAMDCTKAQPKVAQVRQSIQKLQTLLRPPVCPQLRCPLWHRKPHLEM